MARDYAEDARKQSGPDPQLEANRRRLLTNFSQPAKPLSISINYGVDYATDLELLDRVVSKK